MSCHSRSPEHTHANTNKIEAAQIPPSQYTRGRIPRICICECPNDIFAPILKFHYLVGFLELLSLTNVVETKDLDVRGQLAKSVVECGRRCGG